MTDAIAGRRRRADETWVHHSDPRMPEMAHGWKLHVCHVKYARSPEVLRALNSGLRGPGAVGKAVTVYPAPQEVVEIASGPVEVLNGRDGPRVLSDMQVSASAPVYYRCGPFEATYRTGSGGRAGTSSSESPAGTSARGVDRDSGLPVVLKQARAEWLADVDPVVSMRIRTLMRVSSESRLPPTVGGELLDEIISYTVDYCVAAARESVRDGSAPIDLYAGTSGVGLELLHHQGQSGVADFVDLLARWTARQVRDLPASLYSGRTGVALFLQRAGVPVGPVGDDDLLPRRRPDGGPPEAGLIEGAAGVGLGHLLLAAGSGDAARHLAAAAECHRLLTDGTATLMQTEATRPGNAALAEGIAHGDAGVAYFLAEYAWATGDPGSVADARAACDRLAALVPALVARALGADASRRYGSWCRGLAGIGSVLIRAADCLGEPRYLESAGQCADACVAIAPRMPQVIQCCGLAGVGDFLIDAALATGSGQRWHQASGIARLILTRSGGTWDQPVFPDVELTRTSAGWAGGSSGVLGFLRRLRDRGGPRLAATS
jgi:hypothetical protein